MTDFTPLLNRLAARNIRPNTDKAREWFRKKARETRVTRASLLGDGDRSAATPNIGSMYCYQYDPKYAKKLPYYDEFPLIFMVERISGGFVGINLHYVSPRNRIVVMNALSEIASNKRYYSTTRLRLSYNVLKGLSKYNVIKPCLKKYLFTHVRSKFVKIQANEWDIALFLPVQKFKKAAASKVWSDSARRS